MFRWISETSCDSHLLSVLKVVRLLLRDEHFLSHFMKLGGLPPVVSLLSRLGAEHLLFRGHTPLQVEVLRELTSGWTDQHMAVYTHTDTHASPPPTHTLTSFVQHHSLTRILSCVPYLLVCVCVQVSVRNYLPEMSGDHSWQNCTCPW